MQITIIGSGNIATHFARFFYDHGLHITQVYSRTMAHAHVLAEMVSAQAVDKLSELDTEVDLILLAVSDDSIADVAAQLPHSTRAIVVHTSGATPLDVLSAFGRYGVIYPPQSINNHVMVDLSKIPFAIEGSSTEVEGILLEMMGKMAPGAFSCTSKQRLALHLASVFANNFSNALYQIAFDILQRENLDFNLIKPLILETAQKVQTHIPKQVQTGPAIRNDFKTINTHLQFLSNTPEWAEIYQQLTDFIRKSSSKI